MFVNLALEVEAAVELGESLSRVVEEEGESGLVDLLPMPWSRLLNLRLTVAFMVSDSLDRVVSLDGRGFDTCKNQKAPSATASLCRDLEMMMIVVN